MLEHAISARQDFLLPIPKYYCRSCKRCNNKKCSFFNRYVELDYNKCFYHSNYNPTATKYVSPVNIKEIATQNYLKGIA